MSDISIISAVLVVVVAFLAGLEGISTNSIPSTNRRSTLSDLQPVTSKQVLCLVDHFK